MSDNTKDTLFRAHHDMGGLAAGAIDQSQHEFAFWEKRVDALLVLLCHPDRGVMRVDELRRGIESLGVDAYDNLSYYERWISSISYILVEKGVISQEQLDEKIAEIQKRKELP